MVLMPWQLRAMAGPLEGATYRLRMKTSLGRAGDCDIQIINDGVSRRHAAVVVADEGHELIDLGSNNGTFIGDRRVKRHPLRSGDEIRIMRSRFMYELAGEGAPEPSTDVWAVKVTSGVTLRQTVDVVLDAGGPESAPRGDTAEDLEVPGPGDTVTPMDRERHRVKALRPDGRPYEGDLVGDIVLSRDLQLRVTRRESVAPVELERLQQYAESFRQPPGDPSPYGSLRRFVRFRCRFPARVRWLEAGTERTAPIDVEDLGVGGARVKWREHPLHDGVVAWLVIDTVAGARTRTLVFPTRVAWATVNEVGLQFAGIPEQTLA